MARRIDIVFFDATDTLLCVHGTVGLQYAAVAHRHGLEAPAAAIDAAFRKAMSSAPPPCFPGARPEEFPALERAWWHDVVTRTFADFGAFPRFESFFDAVFEQFRTAAAWDLLPGARQALLQLQSEGRRLGIVSDMDGRLFDVLDELQLRTLFDPIVLSTRAGCSKRDGRLFPIALRMAGVPAERAAHVGDSLTSDVAGARAAGLAAIWFDPGGAAAPPGVWTARGWSEVPLRLRELEAVAG
jgi:putative hydrolase of the HAD superfamily